MSSDSDDDCYGNMSEKLKKMKDKLDNKPIETLYFLDDSNELDEIVKNNPLPEKNKRKSSQKKSDRVSSCIVTDDLPDVSDKTTSKRTTRASSRKRKTETSTADNELENLPEIALSSSKKQKTNASGSESCASTSRGRGARGRGRGAPRKRGRGSRGGRGGRRSYWGQANQLDIIQEFFNTIFADRNPHNSSIPTYSIGNTHEYPDLCDAQPLFSNSNQKKQDDVTTIEDEEDNSLGENEELSVKVYWQSSEIFKFTIRRFQKLTQIFDYFAKKENVSHDKLLFIFNDKILKPDDTPDSVGYSIVKFIDGGIVSQGLSELLKGNKEEPEGGLKLKFQCQNVKKPFEISIQLHDKLIVAMTKFAEHIEKPLDKLRFEFDGDTISGKSTASELELEGGECIDVRIVS